MTKPSGSCCAVCGARDARALVEVVLRGGVRATLCGSHALMHRRGVVQASSTSELKMLLRDRRGRRDRRESQDELGSALEAAFSGERRGSDRRQ
jgi:hypothetical protein